MESKKLPKSPHSTCRPAEQRSTSFPLVALLILASLIAAYAAQEILAPIAVAIVLYLVLIRPQRFLMRRGLPAPIGASLMVGALFCGLAIGFYTLAEPFAEWIKRSPTIAYDVERKLGALKKPIKEVKEASKKVEDLAKVEGDQEKATPKVAVENKGRLMPWVFGGLRAFSVQALVCLVLLFFLLSAGDMFKEKLVKVIPTFRDKRRAIDVVNKVESGVAHYLFTITLINIGLGAVIGSGLYLIGLPNAALWGVMAALLNFIPYFGGIVGVIIVTFVAIVSIDSLMEALLAPAIYVVFNGFEGQILTPAILSRRLTLNSVVIFVAVVLWGWLWGAVGALIAVPMLLILKILCDNVERLNGLGEFLAGNKDRL